MQIWNNCDTKGAPSVFGQGFKSVSFGCCGTFLFDYEIFEWTWYDI